VLEGIAAEVTNAAQQHDMIVFLIGFLSGFIVMGFIAFGRRK